MNVLLILTDQHRLSEVGCYGGNVRTPNIDALAQRGVLFTHAFATSAVCTPSRASLYTGLYPHNHGVIGNPEPHSKMGVDVNLKPGIRGINHFLSDAGYVCGYTGKWHVEAERVPTQMGFVGHDYKGYAYPGSGVYENCRCPLAPEAGNHYRQWLEGRGLLPIGISQARYGDNPGNQEHEIYARLDAPVEASIPYYLAEESIRLMRDLVALDGPFFLWVNFWGPHTPCIVPEPYFSMYDPRSFPEHPSFRETFQDKPHVQRTIEKLWSLSGRGWAGWQDILARYCGYVSLIDEMMGRIVAEVDRLGLRDDTMIIFATDHGDQMGAHRLIEKGEFMYEESYHIPLVVSHPRCPEPGGKRDEFVMFHDLFPTILQACGIEPPAYPDCRSFLPAVLGRPFQNSRKEAFCVFTRHFTQFNQRMVRTRTHKFIFNTTDTGELYDLVKDPYELTNRFHDPAYREVKRSLMERMREQMSLVRDPLLSFYDKMRHVY